MGVPESYGTVLFDTFRQPMVMRLFENCWYRYDLILVKVQKLHFHAETQRTQSLMPRASSGISP